MKKWKLFLPAVLLIFVLGAVGCGKKEETEKDNEEEEVVLEDDADTEDPEEIAEAFEDELTPLEGEELEMMEEADGESYSEDDEMIPVDETEMEQEDEETIMEDEDSEDNEAGEDSGNDGSSGGIQVEEDGTYTTKEEVAVYIHTYGKLPSNYITSEEAGELGWVSTLGNLDEVAPGKSIGGDVYSNSDGMLPEEDGRTYQECDIDFEGGIRTEKRIVYSNDGLIFYTEDGYETFEQIY